MDLPKPKESFAAVTQARKDPDGLCDALEALCTCVVIGDENYLRNFCPHKGIDTLLGLVPPTSQRQQKQRSQGQGQGQGRGRGAGVAEESGDVPTLVLRCLATIIELVPGSNGAVCGVMDRLVALVAVSIERCASYVFARADAAALAEEALKIILFASLEDTSNVIYGHASSPIHTLLSTVGWGGPRLNRRTFDTIASVCRRLQPPLASGEAVLLEVVRAAQALVSLLATQELGAADFEAMEAATQCIVAVAQRAALLQLPQVATAAVTAEFVDDVASFATKEPTRRLRVLSLLTALAAVAPGPMRDALTTLPHAQQVLLAVLAVSEASDMSLWLDAPFDRKDDAISLAAARGGKTSAKDVLLATAAVSTGPEEMAVLAALLVTTLCTPPLDGTPSLPAQALLLVRTWRWEDDVHNYSPYPQTESAALEAAFGRGTPQQVRVRSGNRTYVVDIAAQKQQREGGGPGRNVSRDAVPTAYQVLPERRRHTADDEAAVRVEAGRTQVLLLLEALLMPLSAFAASTANPVCQLAALQALVQCTAILGPADIAASVVVRRRLCDICETAVDIVRMALPTGAPAARGQAAGAQGVPAIAAGLACLLLEHLMVALGAAVATTLARLGLLDLHHHQGDGPVASLTARTRQCLQKESGEGGPGAVRSALKTFLQTGADFQHVYLRDLLRTVAASPITPHEFSRLGVAEALLTYLDIDGEAERARRDANFTQLLSQHPEAAASLVRQLVAALPFLSDYILTESLVSDDPVRCRPAAEAVPLLEAMSPVVQLCSARKRLQAPQCPNGHAVQPRVAGTWACDVCGHSGEDRSGVRCDACDYDCCGACLAAPLPDEPRSHVMSTVGDIESFFRGARDPRQLLLDSVRDELTALRAIRTTADPANQNLFADRHREAMAAVDRFAARFSGRVPDPDIAIPQGRLEVFYDGIGRCSYQETLFGMLYRKSFNRHLFGVLIELENALVERDKPRGRGHVDPAATQPSAAPDGATPAEGKAARKKAKRAARTSSIIGADQQEVKAVPVAAAAPSNDISDGPEAQMRAERHAEPPASLLVEALSPQAVEAASQLRTKRLFLHFFQTSDDETSCVCGEHTRTSVARGSAGSALRLKPCDLQRRPEMLLLRLLSGLSRRIGTGGPKSTGPLVPEEVFVSRVLSRRVLMACASSALRIALLDPVFAVPRWAYFLLSECGFLFSASLRQRLASFLAFGARRSLWEHIAAHGLRPTTRVYPSEWVRLQHVASGAAGSRKTVRHVVDRAHLLEDARRLLESTAELRFPINVEFDGEKGTGTGPTVQFFTSVAADLCRKGLHLWRQPAPQEHSSEGSGDIDEGSSDVVEVGREGLYPAIAEPRVATEAADAMYVVGGVLARAYMDGRLCPLPLSTMLMNFLRLGVPAPSPVPSHGGSRAATKAASEASRAASQRYVHSSLTFRNIGLVDAAAYEGLSQLRRLYRTARTAAAPSERLAAERTIEAMDIPFTLIGHDTTELCPGGANRTVSVDAVPEYLLQTAAAMLFGAVAPQISAFVRGFTDIVPTAALRLLTSKEMAETLGTVCDDPRQPLWGPQDARRLFLVDHGYTADSPVVQWLIEAVGTTLTPRQQRQFLEFCTGCPRLPLGGLGAMRRITVVRREPSAGSADRTLVSVNTCFLYLKVPQYSSREVLVDRLIESVTGAAGFDLS